MRFSVNGDGHWDHNLAEIRFVDHKLAKSSYAASHVSGQMRAQAIRSAVPMSQMPQSLCDHSKWCHTKGVIEAVSVAVHGFTSLALEEHPVAPGLDQEKAPSASRPIIREAPNHQDESKRSLQKHQDGACSPSPHVADRSASSILQLILHNKSVPISWLIRTDYQLPVCRSHSAILAAPGVRYVHGSS
jgi:hypothetical protein